MTLILACGFGIGLSVGFAVAVWSWKDGYSEGHWDGWQVGHDAATDKAIEVTASAERWREAERNRA